MPIRERRVIDAVDELIRLYPDDFTSEYSHNNSALMGGMQTYFTDPIDKSTRHKIAGAIAHRIRQYEHTNKNWREEMRTTGHIAPGEKYTSHGTESPGKKKPSKRHFRRY